ncbi:autotransporter domain-containing protein [Candidatus Omnitrophota bacterium]
MIKKVLVIAVVLFFYSTVCNASSMGNKITPIGNMKTAVSAEANFMLDRDMESGGSSTSGSNITSFEMTEIYQYYAKLILGISEYANIYAKLGTSKISEAKVKFSTGEDVTIESEGDLLYGGGFNIIHDFGDYFVGLNGDVSFFDVGVDGLDVTGTTISNISGEFKNTEYQIGGFFGMNMNVTEDLMLTPYVSVFYNKFNADTDGITYGTPTTYTLTFDSDSEDEVGGGVGVDIKLLENMTLNVEGRFATGTSFSVGGTIEF